MSERELAVRLRQIVQYARGDDLERARAAFRGCTPEQMAQQYGQSGRTRQEILTEYEQFRQRDDDVAQFVERMLRREGL